MVSLAIRVALLGGCVGPITGGELSVAHLLLLWHLRWPWWQSVRRFPQRQPTSVCGERAVFPGRSKRSDKAWLFEGRESLD